MNFGEEEKIVEAIDDGRIVRVSESYAKREGLLILRKSAEKISQDGKKFNPAQQFEEDIGRNRLGYGLDNYRKSLKWQENPNVRALVNNFHWRIQKARREKGLTRRQLSNLTGIKENVLKMIEHGFLPENHMVMITNIEQHLGIILRKDAEERNVQPARQLAEQMGRAIPIERSLELEEDEELEDEETIGEMEDEELSGDEIEIEEDDN